ncbi:MAG: hypothetical protein NTZ94_02620 [Verrucomicrobia bacterium]|nr:hypothetical protein [Verrucomicrobiota bacterium]
MKSLDLLVSVLMNGAGLQVYLVAFLCSIGAVPPAWSNPFVLHDIFGDFVKLGFAYYDPIVQIMPATSFVQYKPILAAYFYSNPYSNDPALAGQALTIFHLPPLYQILEKMGSFAMERFDPIDVYIAAVFMLVLWVAYVLKVFRENKKIWIVLFLTIVLSYPSLFAFQRGNLPSYVASMLIISSILLVKTDCSRWPWATMGMALAVAVRPNYILIAGFIPLVIMQEASWAMRMRVIFLTLIAVIAVYGSLMLAASWLVPGYNYVTFYRSYLFYVKEYEFGLAGIDYCSSPFRLVSLAFSDFSHQESQIMLQSFLKSAFIGLGAAISGWGLWLGAIQRVRPSKSLLIFLLGNVVLTPVFADYHLLVFFCPVILSFLEKQVNSLAAFNEPGFTGLELVFTGLFLSPKSLPIVSISGTPVTIQLLLNPVLASRLWVEKLEKSQPNISLTLHQ